MIVTPLARAALTTAFIRGTMAATRSLAPRDQCLSHMSQMIIAVSSARSDCWAVTTCHWLCPVASGFSTWVRCESWSSAAQQDPASETRTLHR